MTTRSSLAPLSSGTVAGNSRVCVSTIPTDPVWESSSMVDLSTRDLFTVERGPELSLQTCDDAAVLLHQCLGLVIAPTFGHDMEAWFVGIGQDQHPFVFQLYFYAIGGPGPTIAILIAHHSHHRSLFVPGTRDICL